MERKSKLQMISVDKLHPHPQNPRKVIGDVTELAESIKANGILQNLTVVPNNDNWDDFTVIIGHRRLAAAKQAGLTELPCAVVEMSEKEQLSTMLTENMQRSDLTVYEEAKGCQLLLDLGDTVAEIAKKTGFSESKIRRRVKLCELDEEAFKESQIGQPTLADYDRLNQIKDIEMRNKLLESIGTNNFDNLLYSAVKKQELVKFIVAQVAAGFGNKRYYFKEIIEHDFEDDENIDSYINEHWNDSGRLLMATAYALCQTGYERFSFICVGYSSKTISRRNNPDLNRFYSLLCKLGYVMSDEEKQLRDGTHPIFTTGEVN